MNGWTGTTLRVNLTNVTFQRAHKYGNARNFFGARGLGTKILSCKSLQIESHQSLFLKQNQRYNF